MNRSLQCLVCRSCVLAIVLVGMSSLAAQETTPEKPAAPAVSEAEINRWIQQLDAPEFADRQAASQKLGELGKRALPALEKAAEGESREAATRAFDLIRKLHDDNDAANKQAAKDVLQRLSESKTAPIARRAKELLQPPMETPNAPAARPGVPAAVPVPGGIRVDARAIGVGRKVSIRNENGVRTIEAEEGEKKVKILDDPNNGIKVEITTQKDGKEETKKYEAKNAEELKKNHPEAHEAYEQYGKAGAFKIQIGGIERAIPVPLPAGAPNAIPAAPADPETLRKLKIESLERTIQNIQKSIDQMEQTKKRLEEQKAEMEKEKGKE